MDNASKNAGDMIGTLQMQYNRGRQAAITNELVDIITGSSLSCRFTLGIPDTCLRCQRLVISENSLEWNRFCLWVQPCDLLFSYLLSGVYPVEGCFQHRNHRHLCSRFLDRASGDSESLHEAEAFDFVQFLGNECTVCRVHG